MGSIIQRQTRDGSVRYQAMVKIPGSKAAVKTFENPEKAQEFIDRTEQQRSLVASAKALRVVQPVSAEQRALDAQKAWSNSWLKESLNERFKDGAMSERDSRSINAITRLAGDVMLGELDRAWVKDYVKRARKTVVKNRGTVYKWATISDHMNIIKSTMRWKATELRALGDRLDFGTKDMPADWDVERDRRLWDHEERMLRERFMAHRDKDRGRHLAYLMTLALNTAARMQELLKAEWSEFNIEGRFWTIPARNTKVKKTRVVPLNKAAMEALAELRLMRDGLGCAPSMPIFNILGGTRQVSCCFHLLTRRGGR